MCMLSENHRTCVQQMERPKSASLTALVSVNRIFSGLMSRWMTPLELGYVSARTA